MKKYTKKVLSILLIMSIFLMQGCALVEPETSHLVTVSTDGKTLTADLKASVGDGYEWRYMLDEHNIIETTKKFSNNIFSDTYGSTYTFTANDAGRNVFYLILVKDGDLENAKVFSYALSVDNTARITIDKEVSFLLGSDVKLYKRVTSL